MAFYPPILTPNLLILPDVFLELLLLRQRFCLGLRQDT